MLPSEIGAAVKAAREERGLTIKELARYTHLGPRTIARPEQGDFDKLSVLGIVSMVLGLTLTIGVERATWSSTTDIVRVGRPERGRG